MPARVTMLKPVSVNVTVYSPGRRSTILYWPLPSVTALLVFSMSAGLAASTLTPGSAPPVASLTTPAIALCAEARPSMSANADTTVTAVIKLRINILSFIDVSGRCRCWSVVASGRRAGCCGSFTAPAYDTTWLGTSSTVFASAQYQRQPGLVNSRSTASEPIAAIPDVGGLHHVYGSMPRSVPPRSPRTSRSCSWCKVPPTGGSHASSEVPRPGGGGAVVNFNPGTATHRDRV